MALDVQSDPSFHFIFVDGKVQSWQIPELKSNEEEADSKIVRAIDTADISNRIVVIVGKAHDTGIAVILT